MGRISLTVRDDKVKVSKDKQRRAFELMTIWGAYIARVNSSRGLGNRKDSSHHKSGNDTEQTSGQEAGKEKALRKAVVVDWYTANASPNNYLTIFETPYWSLTLVSAGVAGPSGMVIARYTYHNMFPRRDPERTRTTRARRRYIGSVERERDGLPKNQYAYYLCLTAP